MKTVHIVGGGTAGCFLAYFLKDKFHVIMYEKDTNIGGLSRTLYNIENIPYQKGFNILSTNEQWILNIAQRAGLNLQRVFYNCAINPLVDLKTYRFPLTIKTINTLPWHWCEAINDDLLKTSTNFGDSIKDMVVNFYGNTIYEVFYKNLILKLTGNNESTPAWFKRYIFSLDRVANFYSSDCYFPVDEGWNKLFDYLTQGVEVVLNSEVNHSSFSPDDIIVLTTQVDKFIYRNDLPYMGMLFDIDSVAYQPEQADTTFYPNDVSFLSITQYGKLFNPSKHIDNKNIITKETTRFNFGEFVYPILTEDNILMHTSLVEELSNQFKHIYFCGPRATYSHMDMADIIENAHRVAGEMKHNIDSR